MLHYCMNITVNGNEYWLHQVDKRNAIFYSNILNKLNVCDRRAISREYEQISYDMLQEDGYIGFFISNLQQTQIYGTIIIDVDCNQVADKLPENMVKNTVEMVLVCSNVANKIKRVMFETMRYLLQYVVPNLKSKHVTKHVALKNANAIRFYTSLGFQPTQHNNVMIYSFAKKSSSNTSSNKKSSNKKLSRSSSNKKSLSNKLTKKSSSNKKSSNK